MRLLQSLLGLILCICFINSSFASENNYNDITLFDFDASCMQKHVYEVDKEFVLDDNHTAYHISLGHERTLVLKVMDTEEGLSDVKTSLTVAHDCKSVKGIQPNFIVGLNNGSTPVFIKTNNKYYKVSLGEYNVDNDAFFSSFAPPHHSLVYEYNHDYDPLETLRPAALDALDYDTRNYNYSTDQEKDEYNFVYLQIYRDVCANRPFGVVTPRTGMGEDNPYKYQTTTNSNTNTIASSGKKQIYRTCQHPIEVTHIQGIGTTKRSYTEDEKIYTSRLVSIDGVPLTTYMENHKFHHENQDVAKAADLMGDLVWEYDLTKAPKASPYQPQYVQGNASNVGKKEVTMVADNTAKGREIPKVYSIKTTKPETVALKVPVVLVNGQKHVVKEGETLYSISQQYQVSVLDIKIDNQLSENTIEIGQELVIGEK